MVLFYLCFFALLLWLLSLFNPDMSYRFNDVLPDSHLDHDMEYPKITLVIPCRDEEEILTDTLQSLTNQNYPNFEIIFVDDCSQDNSKTIAAKILQKIPHKIISGKAVPDGWAGKMWALKQGIEEADGKWIMLSDADICYTKNNILSSLMNIALKNNYKMVSVMVSLSTKFFWEKFLIPSFVYFFKMLYPFKAIRNPKRKVAAAAGGCVLIEKEVLDKIGGIESIHSELIDDVALAKRVKKHNYPISLWLSKNITSIRRYPFLKNIWSMVVRSAFTELKYSYFRLLFCVLGMTLLFALPIYSIVYGMFYSNSLFVCGLLTYTFMTFSYTPCIRFYNVPLPYVLCLPLIGILYMFMTLDSALKYTFGVKAVWKGRSYEKS